MRPIFILFLAISSLLAAESQKLKVKVAAKTAILINAKTGTVLFEKDSHLRMFPSSITKIATCHYFLEKIGMARLDEVVAAPGDCLTIVPANVRSDPSCPSYRLDPRGTRMWLIAGEKVAFRTLLYGAMLPSGNDATNVLAFHCSGSIPQFMEELNIFVKKLGAQNTLFANPHGLHDNDHYTTAYDMALIGKAALNHPIFREIVKTEVYPRPKTNKQPPSTLDQHNLLVRRGPYYYSKATGVKTGGAFLSKNTLVAAAEDGNRSLIAVFLGCGQSKQNFRDAATLFDTAFAEKTVMRTFFAKGCDTFSLEVKGGARPVKGGLFADLTVTYYPSEEPEVRAILKWDSLEMPIREGERLGEIQLVTADQTVIKCGALFAVEDVEPTLTFQVKTILYQYRAVLIAILMCLCVALAIFRVHEKRPRKGTRKGE